MTDFEPGQRNDMRARYMAVDTSNVADVLDTLGYLDQGLAPDFAPFPRTAGRIAGWAHTIRGQMTPYEQGGDADKMRACQALGDDEISVWSGDGEGICYFGELIAIGMKERGCAGALVDGGIRDVRWIGELGFPVFARYRTPVQSIGRWKVTASQIPVYMRGARGSLVIVRPGDFIELFGRTMPIEDVARAAGTVDYELLTSLGNRYERRYEALKK